MRTLSLLCLSFLERSRNHARQLFVDVLERMYQNQWTLEASIMALAQREEQRDSAEVGENVSEKRGQIYFPCCHVQKYISLLFF